MKFKFTYTTLGLLFFGYLFLSLSGGRTGAYAGHPSDTGTCNNCHSGTGSGSIALTGAPAAYEAGVTYPLTLTLTDAPSAGNPNARGGFQIVATNGTTNTQVGTFTTPAGTKLNDINRLVQSTPLNFSGATSVAWSFDWTAPSSGAPANIRFYFTGNAADGGGGPNPGDTGYANSTANIPLPVELSYFEIKPMDNEMVKLNWVTQSEQNSDYFEIQRSREESENEFETIGRVFSAGNSNEQLDYDFLDEEPLFNQHSYYRLKQVDLDGEFAFSTVKNIKIKTEEEFAIYPNPVRSGESFNLKYTSTTNQDRRVHIVNLSGQKVFEKVIDSENGLNNFEIQMPELAVGTYFISLFQNGELIDVKKILIQE